MFELWFNLHCLCASWGWTKQTLKGPRYPVATSSVSQSETLEFMLYQVSDHTSYPLTLLGIRFSRTLGLTWPLKTNADLLPEAETKIHSAFVMHRRSGTTILTGRSIRCETTCRYSLIANFTASYWQPVAALSLRLIPEFPACLESAYDWGLTDEPTSTWPVLLVFNIPAIVCLPKLWGSAHAPWILRSNA